MLNFIYIKLPYAKALPTFDDGFSSNNRTVYIFNEEIHAKAKRVSKKYATNKVS